MYFTWIIAVSICQHQASRDLPTSSALWRVHHCCCLTFLHSRILQQLRLPCSNSDCCGPNLPGIMHSDGIRSGIWERVQHQSCQPRGDGLCRPHSRNWQWWSFHLELPDQARLLLVAVLETAHQHVRWLQACSGYSGTCLCMIHKWFTFHANKNCRGVSNVRVPQRPLAPGECHLGSRETGRYCCNTALEASRCSPGASAISCLLGALT